MRRVTKWHNLKPCTAASVLRFNFSRRSGPNTDFALCRGGSWIDTGIRRCVRRVSPQLFVSGVIRAFLFSLHVRSSHSGSHRVTQLFAITDYRPQQQPQPGYHSQGPSSPADALFPLRLVPFEAMTHYDNWPSYPMSCGAIFRFRGRLRRSVFESAMHAANARHPLVEANLDRVANRLAWVPASGPFRPRWLGSDDATEFAQCVPFDLTKETGIRLWLQRRGDESAVFVEFHHTCCDGAGGLAYMEDVFGIYASAIDHGKLDDSTLPPTNPVKLKDRGRFPTTHSSVATRCQATWSDLKTSSSLSLQKTTPLAYRNSAGDVAGETASEWSRLRFISRVFNREVYQQLRARAAQQSVTLNDYLVHKLFVTIRDWNQEVDQIEKSRLRILIPVNLRRRSDLDMSMTNRLSYGFIARASREIASTSEALQKIAAENAWIRRAGLPLRLLNKLGWLQATGAWPLVFSPKRCLSTAVFSNLGDPTRRFRVRFPRQNGLVRIGNLLLTSFEGTTALRPMTRAGLFFNTYRNRLTISARFDPLFYSIADAESFLDTFAAQIDVPSRPRILAA